MFALFTPDGSCLDDNLSPEAYSTGLRQLIELCKDTHQLDQLSRHNRASLTDLRIQVPTLRNSQGVHFADLLLRLMQRRREKLSGASTASAKSDSPAAKLASDNVAGSLIEADSHVEPSGVAMKGDAAPPADEGDHTRRTQIHEPGAAFRRYAGRSPRKRTPYSFPRRSEVPGASLPSPHAKSAPVKGDLGGKEVRVQDNAPSASVPTSRSLTVLENVTEVASATDFQNPENGKLAIEIAVTEKPALAPTAPSKIAFGMKIDKSKLFLGLERRIRDKVHLRRVSELPCLVCNRQPSHAHHLRFAQRRGLSQKVSDEYVVPLCALHHGDLHRSSSEQEWWLTQRIEPLAMAAELWIKFHHR